MSDYLNPDQIRDLYAEIIDKHVGDPDRGTDVRKLLAYEAVDALAAAGLLPTVSLNQAGTGRVAYRTEFRDKRYPPPPPAPGKGRGPR